MTAVADTPQWQAIASHLERRGDLQYLPLLLERKSSVEMRRQMTAKDPKLFWLYYLHETCTYQDQISFGRHHEQWLEIISRWPGLKYEPRENRHAWISARGSGKTTVAYKIVPLFMAAHGYSKLTAAFSSNATAAETHLSGVRRELSHNDLLKRDFPELCRPAVRSRGMTVADTHSLFVSRSGWAMGAYGIEHAALGLKVDNNRPDLTLIDDLDGAEGAYTDFTVEQRLHLLNDMVLPLQAGGRGPVIVTGTVTLENCIAHQLVRTVTHPDADVPTWIRDSNLQVSYWPALLTNDDGTEESTWPAMWSTADLQKQRYTRHFLKAMQNTPMSSTDAYWRPEDFERGHLTEATFRVISVDPAVTTSKKSDFTALVVVSASRRDKKFAVEEAFSARLRGDQLRPQVQALLDRHAGVCAVIIEKNQGGDLYKSLLKGMSVRPYTFSVAGAKEIRAQQLLNDYQVHHRVLHAPGLTALEGEMLSFPYAAHDDLVDATANAVAFLKKKLRGSGGPSVKTVSYI